MIKVAKLREMIRAKGLKEKWVAEKSGMTQTALSNRLTGRVKMTMDDLARIAKAVNLTDQEIGKIVKA